MRHLAFVSLLLSTAALTACKQENSGFCPDGDCVDASPDVMVRCSTEGPDDSCPDSAPVCGGGFCGPCTMDEQCVGRTGDVCGGGACVECDEEGTQAAMPNGSEDECQTPGEQVCDATTQTCRACTVGSECASDVCRDGTCIDEDMVAYVAVDGPGTAGTLCAAAMPCPKVADAIDTGRPYILVRPGEYDGALDFNGDNGTVFAAGATFRRSMNGRVLHVHGGGGGSTVTIYGGTFTGQGGDSADVIDVDSGSRLTLDGVTVTSGEAIGIGSTGTLTLRRTTVTTNNGVGVSVNNSGTPFEMISSRILSSRQNGLTVTAQRATIVNNVIARNGTDGPFAAIRLDALVQPSQSQIEFNTIVSNPTDALVGGAVVCGAVTTVLRNSIIFGNGGAAEVSGCAVQYSTVEGMANAVNNVVDVAPTFVNTGINDFHLAPGSPLRGLADPAVPTGAATVDMDGQSRPAPAGGAPDLGADEIE